MTASGSSPMASPPPSGQQWEIAAGEWRATIVEVGGGLRVVTAGDRDVLEPYAVDAMCDGAHGAPLVPWPNRLADGRYTFDGVDLQLPLTEPTRNNAIHGLLRWQPWQLVDRQPSRVVVGAHVHPQSGYPFDLDVSVAYALGGDGLEVTTTATNLGGSELPFATGQHPYVSPGPGRLDACVLTLPARTRVLTDARQMPSGTEPVAGTAHDFLDGRELGDLVLDDAFRDLDRDADGLAWTALRGADGLQVRLWQDASYPFVQVFSGDTLASSRRRTGLAVEPMTALANAFSTGDDVRRLAPGDTAVSRWGLDLG